MLSAKELEFIWTPREISTSEVEIAIIDSLYKTSIDRRTIKARVRQYASSSVDRALFKLLSSGKVISTNTAPAFYTLIGQKLCTVVRPLIKAKKGNSLKVLKFLGTGPKTIVEIRSYLNQDIEPGMDRTIASVNSIMFRLTGKAKGHAVEVIRKNGYYKLKGE